MIVERIKIWIAEHALNFQAAHVNAASAVLLSKPELLQKMLHALKRRHEHPAKTIRCFFYYLGHPAVVTPRYREIDVRPAAHRRNEKRRIDHLYVYAQLIQMFDAQ